MKGRIGEPESRETSETGKGRIDEPELKTFRRFTDSSFATTHRFSGGFTLIELLIVITIIGMMFSVSVPMTYSIYQRYQASLKAEKVLTFVSSMRLEAFLHSGEKFIESKEGRMLVNGTDPGGFEDLF